jgi:hypothetical protein
VTVNTTNKTSSSYFNVFTGLLIVMFSLLI